MRKAAHGGLFLAQPHLTLLNPPNLCYFLLIPPPSTLAHVLPCRTFAPKPEPVLRSPRYEEAKHLLQRARMKARTRPLRASHDIVPTIAQDSR